MNPVFPALVAALGLAGPAVAGVPGFVRASGTVIVDGDGKPALKRGVNLGGWLLWESYLLDMGKPETESRLKTAIVKLAGRDEAYRFFRAYRDNYITEADIRKVKELGFDHVRLPVNWRILADTPHFDMKPGEGWRLVDAALDWCEKAGIYAVLDLHGAPGGQNPGGISDGNLKAELFEGPAAADCRRETVALWKRIAERYRGREVVAAYDLLNEPAFKDSREDSKLKSIYEELVREIRAVDPRHMIMLEGNWWAADFGAFRKALAPNTAWHFHKYWTDTGPDMIGYLLELRERTGTPLYLGEFGENNNRWMARCVGAVEERGIGWCFWPWKRRGGGCAVGVSLPQSWKKVVAAYGDDKPATKQEIREGLDALAEALKLANCREDGNLLEALKGRELPHNYMAPGDLRAADYDRGAGVSRYNQGGVYRPGDMDVYNDGQGGHRVRLAPGERLEFDFKVRRGEEFSVSFRGAAEGETGLKWLVKGVGSGQARFSGGDTEWVPGGKAEIPAGDGVFTVEAGSEVVYLAGVRLQSCPGRIEAEDYDEEGTKDNDPGNNGKEYRPGGSVDIENCGDGGYNVGWMDAGEVLAYSFEVCRPGKYDLILRTASGGDGGLVRAAVDGGKPSPDVTVPGTGWTQSYTDVVIPGYEMAKGRHRVVLEVAKGWFNLDCLLFVPAK